MPPDRHVLSVAAFSMLPRQSKEGLPMVIRLGLRRFRCRASVPPNPDTTSCLFHHTLGGSRGPFHGGDITGRGRPCPRPQTELQRTPMRVWAVGNDVVPATMGPA